MKNILVYKEVCIRICVVGLCIIVKRWEEFICILYGNNFMSIGIVVLWEILEVI